MALKLKLPRPQGLTTRAVSSSVSRIHNDDAGVAAAAPTDGRGMQITSRESLQGALVTDLHSSVKGRGLRENALVPYQHRWVAEPTRLLSVTNYIGTVKGRLPYGTL